MSLIADRFGCRSRMFSGLRSQWMTETSRSAYPRTHPNGGLSAGGAANAASSRPCSAAGHGKGARFASRGRYEEAEGLKDLLAELADEI